MNIVKKALLLVVSASMVIWIGFVVHDYLEHRAAMAQWAPEKASVDATNDIAAGCWLASNSDPEFALNSDPLF